MLMKPVSRVNYRNDIIQEMTDVVLGNDYNTNINVQAKIYDAWKGAKTRGGILPLLRKHPNWDERHKMIWFDADYTREINKDQLWKFADFLYKIIDNKLDDDKPSVISNFIRNNINGQFFDSSMDGTIGIINSINPEYKLRNNMKSSKAILKICREEGWDKLGGTYIDHNGKEKRVFDREYAKLADALNPIKVKRHTIISLNPVDFYYMSHGHDWNSCHDIISRGCYSSGTVSYMLDEGTFIFYTLPAEYNGSKPELQEKMNREVFSWKGGTFLQSRLYPQANDCGAEHAYKEIREVVQKVLADCMQEENLWNAPKRDLDFINDHVRKGNGATCYADWQPGCPGSQHVLLSSLKGWAVPDTMVVGAKPICVNCGCTHSTTESISCCDSYRCEKCGAALSEDETFYCDDVGEERCSSCSFWCNSCENSIAIENEVEVFAMHGGRSFADYYCLDCANEYARECERCGELWHIDDMDYIDDDYFCPECASEIEHHYCPVCGGCHEDDNMLEIDGRFFCNEHCYTKWMDGRF